MRRRTTETVDAGATALRRYYSQIPNLIVDDPRVCPFGLALYVYYKRVAAEEGECFRDQETVERETGISKTKIVECRRVLEGLGYLKVEVRHLRPTKVTIVDIWDANIRAYVPAEPVFEEEPDCIREADAEGVYQVQTEAAVDATRPQGDSDDAADDRAIGEPPCVRVADDCGRVADDCVRVADDCGRHTDDKNNPSRTTPEEQPRKKTKTPAASRGVGLLRVVERLVAEYGEDLGTERVGLELQRAQNAAGFRTCSDQEAYLREWLEDRRLALDGVTKLRERRKVRRETRSASIDDPDGDRFFSGRYGQYV